MIQNFYQGPTAPSSTAIHTPKVKTIKKGKTNEIAKSNNAYFILCGSSSDEDEEENQEIQI
jgi:hypothetical protein